MPPECGPKGSPREAPGKPKEAAGERRRGGQPLKRVVTWCGVPVLEWKPGRASCVGGRRGFFRAVGGCLGLFVVWWWWLQG